MWRRDFMAFANIKLLSVMGANIIFLCDTAKTEKHKYCSFGYTTQMYI